ncbi:MAG TPA: NAD(P)H-dependent oxidoreductase [Beijerinckiaceae bacterium]|nr:NAD(P)H-dependent oxidoreductase [Beijerinckiaceae bacterium]
MARRILVILGHPAEQSFCRALAESYVAGAGSAGHYARVIDLRALTFDPVLHGGYGGEQSLESDLVRAQESILWAQHLVFVYPIWWGAVPALLKGFIDRVFLPGFAFKYHKDKISTWDKLLSGRTARLLVTMDSPPWYFRFVSRAPGHNQMRRTILEFCGVKPVAISSFGSVQASDAARRAAWLKQAEGLGSAGS